MCQARVSRAVLRVAKPAITIGPRKVSVQRRLEGWTSEAAVGASDDPAERSLDSEDDRCCTYLAVLVFDGVGETGRIPRRNRRPTIPEIDHTE